MVAMFRRKSKDTTATTRRVSPLQIYAKDHRHFAAVAVAHPKRFAASIRSLRQHRKHAKALTAQLQRRRHYKFQNSRFWTIPKQPIPCPLRPERNGEVHSLCELRRFLEDP